MSIRTILYLSRHGQTLLNELFKQTGDHWRQEWADLEGIRDLTPQGQRQARTLAQFLGVYIIDDTDPKDVQLLTSTEPRSRDTGDIIQVYNRLPNRAEASVLLREQIPKEIAVIRPEDDNEKSREWYAGLRPAEELAIEFTGELERKLQKFNGKTVIAPLHGTMNNVFLNYVGLEPRHMGNCCLIPILYHDGKFTQTGQYVSNKTMRQILQA
jgi:broad specificity phosphatase PhoE